MRTLELTLDGQHLDPRTLWTWARTALDPEVRWAIRFAPAAIERMNASAAVIAGISAADEPVYGVNTGFGHFAERRIPADRLEQLQVNLIRSHACGVGEELTRDVVLAMWLLRFHTIGHGHSGVRTATLEFFVRLLRAGILGCVPSRGSVGACGDLTPSAHAVLTALGEGYCTRPLAHGLGFERVKAADALARIGLAPIPLGPKEELALINGTQYTTALATKVWYEATHLFQVAALAASMSMEALGQARSILDPQILDTHHAQTRAAGRQMAAWLADSAPSGRDRGKSHLVQTPYCLRCAPQVHGAVLLALESSEATLTAEIQAVSDNPLVFANPQGDEIHSCGNFHAIYPARVCDNLASALTTLGSIAERRISMAMDDRLSGLPCFLAEAGGLNSGLMIVQVVAASLVSECKTLCMPASVDSIPTNCAREDHVSMGPIAGLKALEVVDRVRQILAMELLVAARALDLREQVAIPDRLTKIHHLIRQRVPVVTQDRELSSDIALITEMIKHDAFRL